MIAIHNCKQKTYISGMRNLAVTEPSKTDLQDMLDAAVKQYGPRCLWNIRPTPAPQSMRIVARQLKTYGNLAAWRLGAKIEAELDNAA
jgi:hypothetical protein